MEVKEKTYRKRWWENIAKDRKVIPDPIDEKDAVKYKWRWDYARERARER